MGSLCSKGYLQLTRCHYTGQPWKSVVHTLRANRFISLSLFPSLSLSLSLSISLSLSLREALWMCLLHAADFDEAFYRRGCRTTRPSLSLPRSSIHDMPIQRHYRRALQAWKTERAGGRERA